MPNKLYLCNPRKNTECKKTACQSYCFMTTKKECSLDGVGMYVANDAITVEWLLNLRSRYLEADCPMSVCVVNEILNLWEKENAED